MSIFKGAGVALVTPFNEADEVDYERLEEMIEYQIGEETDALIVCGSTGEASTMSHEEQLSCIRFAVEKTKHRVPVIAGTGSNCTKSAVRLAMEAEKLGADALLVVTPYYNKGTQNGLILHFKTIADSVSIPIILYNIPGRTGVNLLPQTAVTLANECSNIIAIKEASGNISQIAELAALANGCLDIYSGNDDQIVPILSLGGLGVISVVSNILPKETHDMVMAFHNGNPDESLRIQLRLHALLKALTIEVNPIPIKAALNLAGKCVGMPRSPLTEIEPQHLEILSHEMNKLGIL